MAGMYLIRRLMNVLHAWDMHSLFSAHAQLVRVQLCQIYRRSYLERRRVNPFFCIVRRVLAMSNHRLL